MALAYVKGDIICHPSCQPSVHLQMSQFNPMRRDNTDGLLDLLTYAPKVQELYAAEILRSNVIDEQEFSALTVVEDNSPF